MFNKEEISVGAAKLAVQTFASLVLNLSPVNPDQAQGFIGTYEDSDGKIKQFFVSHRQIIHIYSSINRFMRDLNYDTNVIKRDVEGSPYMCFEKEHNGMRFGRRIYLSPGMETIFDIPLTGGKW